MWNFLSCMSEDSRKNFGAINATFIDEASIQKGATQNDIEISRVIGFHPLDVKAIREFTLEYKMLLIFRCPKADARGFIGMFPAKKWAVKTKTDASGTVSKFTAVGSEQRFVSDYDLMSVYRIGPNGSTPSKIFFSNVNPRQRSSLAPEATEICRNLNRKLINKIQHGAQDDWKSKGNRGVRADDKFVAGLLGEIRPLGGVNETKEFYQRLELGAKPYWPYGIDGKIIL